MDILTSFENLLGRGHENMNTTARYTRPGRADLEAAVEKIA